ncbi:MAG TPA: hypothetical protein VJY35_12545 [Candidatus Eisenbacteria bacterium]|nr:hypothetical protein [Candidatus Eisenbacteria bacterium]
MSTGRGWMPLVATAWIAGTLALGGLWLADRGRRWEEPHWPDPSFVALRGAPAQGPIRVIAVNPSCSRCLESLRIRAGADDRVALIVDTPRRPGVEMLRAIPAVAVVWDRGGVWRARWGHRVYGEILDFDAAGRLVSVRLEVGETSPPR